MPVPGADASILNGESFLAPMLDHMRDVRLDDLSRLTAMTVEGIDEGRELHAAVWGELDSNALWSMAKRLRHGLAQADVVDVSHATFLAYKSVSICLRILL